MKNPKKIGNEYERKIIDITNEYLGSGYTRTKLSGGADDSGDMKDFFKTTPLSRYCIETKWHGSIQAFNKSFISDIKQAIRQTPSNRNWLLIVHLPKTDIELAVLDYKDYLVNDILGQMLVSNDQAKQIIKDLESGKYKISRSIEKLKAIL